MANNPDKNKHIGFPSPEDIQNSVFDKSGLYEKEPGNLRPRKSYPELPKRKSFWTGAKRAEIHGGGSL